jgi:hypothetical protein
MASDDGGKWGFIVFILIFFIIIKDRKTGDRGTERLHSSFSGLHKMKMRMMMKMMSLLQKAFAPTPHSRSPSRPSQ